jgi:hypothetical protein
VHQQISARLAELEQFLKGSGGGWIGDRSFLLHAHGLQLDPLSRVESSRRGAKCSPRRWVITTMAARNPKFSRYLITGAIESRRGRHQFQLLTLVYLSLAAGTFMLVNTMARHDWPRPFCEEPSRPYTNLQSYGFPYPYRWTWVDESGASQSFFFDCSFEVNGIVGVLSLTVLGLFCEWSLRRVYVPPSFR